jgi:hypothetical protein
MVVMGPLPLFGQLGIAALLSLQVFGPDSKQERVYKQAIVPIVQEVLDGFNCTIFAYGQTGTGKTYTMEGGPRNSVDGSNLSAEAGVIPRAIKQIFDAIECNEVTDSSVKVSFMELYNEELTDLLSPGDDKDKRLRLLEDRSGVVVQGLEEMVVKNAAGESVAIAAHCCVGSRVVLVAVLCQAQPARQQLQACVGKNELKLLRNKWHADMTCTCITCMPADIINHTAAVCVQYVFDCHPVLLRTSAEIYQVLDRGTSKRRTAETLLNKRSSRSHSVFTITIHMKETTPEGEDVIKIGKLNLVDLAGSENISRCGGSSCDRSWKKR